MFEMKNLLTVCVLILIGTSQSYAEDTDEDVWAECRATDSCTIEYDYLANQETDPFLFSGKVMDREHPRWSQYRSAIRSYADVRDCLVRSEVKKETPNLTLINWKKMRSGKIIEVCLFRVFSSLGSPENAKLWLEVQGLKNASLNVRKGRVVRDWKRVEVTLASVSAWNPPKETGRCLVSRDVLSALLCAKIVHSESFSASWNENGVLRDTGYSQTSK